MRTNPEIDAVEREMRHLRIEFERYFNGALDLPPGDLQYQVEKKLRDLRGSVKTSIDRYRLTSLEATFNSYNEMFNRRLRAYEEGREKKSRKREQGPPRYDVESGVTIGDQIEAGPAAALYQKLYADSPKSRQVDLESFRSYLGKQVTMIRQKTGCSQVQFRLANEGGKLKLKAKPLRQGKAATKGG